MRALLLGQGVDINGGPDAPTSLADRRTPHSSCAANAFWCCELLVQRPDGPSMSRRARLPAMLPVDVVALSQALRFLRTVGAGLAKAARLRMNVKASPVARATGRAPAGQRLAFSRCFGLNTDFAHRSYPMSTDFLSSRTTGKAAERLGKDASALASEAADVQPPGP